MKRIPLPRIGPGALILLGHMLLAYALLQHVGAPTRGPEPAPANYIELAFIAAPRMPVPAAAAPAAAAAADRRPAVAPRSPVRRPAVTAPVESALVAVPVLASEEHHAAEAPDVAPQPGRVNMEALRAAARQADSERGPVALEPLRASDDSALARAVRKAKVPDCQTKYAGGEKANILLLVPLAIDTITGKGCNW
ncbi:hypothetical protein [Massilia arenae]|uniref:Uncharacterized protein n=1 Tax=Massilia arenae TaxID=2603288 RepID=A0A5C7G2P4_9BURK|nr:hypothetical protein [Massilia arenae]TXF97565.1 hypothetical protein FVD38_20360 [Massilia arenae]